MTNTTEPRQPTADEVEGMKWWNSMTKTEREKALENAGWKSGGTYTPSAADAWALYKKRIGLEKGTSASRTIAVGDLAKNVDAYFDTFGGDSHDDA